jgi:hypothetical protein
MRHSSMILRTLISPTPVFEPTIRPPVHDIPGIVGMMLHSRHEYTGLPRAYNGCNRCKCIPFSTPPLLMVFPLSSPVSADVHLSAG